jgi:hypothetical protein
MAQRLDVENLIPRTAPVRGWRRHRPRRDDVTIGQMRDRRLASPCDRNQVDHRGLPVVLLADDAVAGVDKRSRRVRGAREHIVQGWRRAGSGAEGEGRRERDEGRGEEPDRHSMEHKHLLSDPHARPNTG